MSVVRATADRYCGLNTGLEVFKMPKISRAAAQPHRRCRAGLAVDDVSGLGRVRRPGRTMHCGNGPGQRFPSLGMHGSARPTRTLSCNLMRLTIPALSASSPTTADARVRSTTPMPPKHESSGRRASLLPTSRKCWESPALPCTGISPTMLLRESAGLEFSPPFSSRAWSHRITGGNERVSTPSSSSKTLRWYASATVV